MEGLVTEMGMSGQENLKSVVTANANISGKAVARFNTEETLRSNGHSLEDGRVHEKESTEQKRISPGIAYVMIAHIEATHRTVIRTQIRRLETLSASISEKSSCNCRELGKVMAGFEKFQSVLMPSMIRERCLLMPTVLQKFQAESSGTEFCESYRGELADLIRTTEADHHQLQSLSNQLRADLNILMDKGACTSIVNAFASQFVNFADFLSLQFELEDTFLRSCCAGERNCE